MLPSLLDVVDAREKKAGRESLTHLCYVATTSSDTSAVMAAHDDACIADALAGGSLTGICLAQNGCVLHYLECPTLDMLSLLREIQSELPLSDTLGSEGCRVLIASQDCDERYFSSWTRMQLEGNEEGEVSVPVDEEATMASFDVLKTLMTIGEGISTATVSVEEDEDEDEDPDAALLPGAGSKEAASLVQKMCPSKARVQALSESSAFFTLDEYLEAFDTSVEVELESESVWPHQPTVDYDGIN